MADKLTQSSTPPTAPARARSSSSEPSSASSRTSPSCTRSSPPSWLPPAAGTHRPRPAPKCVVVAASHGVRRASVVPVTVRSALRSGSAVASPTVPSPASYCTADAQEDAAPCPAVRAVGPCGRTARSRSSRRSTPGTRRRRSRPLPCSQAMGVSGKVLLIAEDHERTAIKSFRNLDHVIASNLGQANTYDVLWADTIVMSRGTLDLGQVAATRHRRACRRRSRRWPTSATKDDALRLLPQPSSPLSWRPTPRAAEASQTVRADAPGSRRRSIRSHAEADGERCLHEQEPPRRHSRSRSCPRSPTTSFSSTTRTRSSSTSGPTRPRSSKPSQRDLRRAGSCRVNTINRKGKVKRTGWEDRQALRHQAGPGDARHRRLDRHLRGVTWV